MNKPGPATAPRIVSDRTIPYETARDAVLRSCPDADIDGWLTSFVDILIAASDTTADPVEIKEVFCVLNGLTHGIRAHMAECFERAMKMVEEA